MPGQLADILASYEGEKGATIPAVQQVQQELGRLCEEVVSEIARFLNLSENEVFWGSFILCPISLHPLESITLGSV